jgi:23S rRNA pseudouridine1911/1915/1917 synthase
MHDDNSYMTIFNILCSTIALMETPKIIFQDDSILVLNKPSGWITNDADTTTTQPVIQSWLRENFDYPLIGDREGRDGIVHRLDKETSGVLLVAKTKEAFDELQRQFKERIVEKSYIALAHGKVIEKEGEIKAAVGRLPWRRDRFGILPGGRDSQTFYKVKDYYGDNTLLELFPKTGRTHQIRIHLKHIGHPIVGDEFYAGRKTARRDRLWIPRLFLHAASVEFIHPTSKEKTKFEAPLAEDLQKALDGLQL